MPEVAEEGVTDSVNGKRKQRTSRGKVRGIRNAAGLTRL